MDEQDNKAKVKIGMDSKYEIDNDYLPTVLKHNKEIELIRARKALLESIVIISPVILVIFLCSVVISNNLRMQNNNYEKSRTEQVQ